jgi:hypothetical protein
MNCKKFKTHVWCNYYGAVTLLQLLTNGITLYAQIIHYVQLKCCFYDKDMTKISPCPSYTQNINDMSNTLSFLACIELQCMIGATHAQRRDAITLSIHMTEHGHARRKTVFA